MGIKIDRIKDDNIVEAWAVWDALTMMQNSELASTE
jgi:hypothetical protein